MANYKPVSSVQHSRFQDPLYEDRSSIAIVSGTSNTFGAWVQDSADIGTSKALYLIGLNSTGGDTPSGQVVVEIAEGAGSSEVAVLRLNLGLYVNGTGMIYIKIYKVLTDNARITARIKDGETTNNNYDIVLNVGAK